jgi:sugar/nucleoside kinase (ribokinase family)
VELSRRVPTPSYLVLSHVIIDDLRLPDGTDVRGKLGGAATYAAVGLSLAGHGGIGLACGIGADFGAEHYKQLRDYRVDTAAMTVRGAYTPRSWVVYADDGERVETPQHGAEHFRSMGPRASDVPHSWRPLRGVYLFAQADQEYFDDLDVLLRSATNVMWELSAESCEPRSLPTISALLPRVDWISLNRTEALRLLGEPDMLSCLRSLLRAGARGVTLRLGADGALIGHGSHVLHVGPASSHPIDPTGAGNCHCGAFLAGWCETGDLALAGKMAAVAASRAIEQFGPPSGSERHHPPMNREAAVRLIN